MIRRDRQLAIRMTRTEFDRKALFGSRRHEAGRSKCADDERQKGNEVGRWVGFAEPGEGEKVTHDLLHVAILRLPEHFHRNHLPMRRAQQCSNIERSIGAQDCFAWLAMMATIPTIRHLSSEEAKGHEGSMTKQVCRSWQNAAGYWLSFAESLPNQGFNRQIPFDRLRTNGVASPDPARLDFPSKPASASAHKVPPTCHSRESASAHRRLPNAVPPCRLQSRSRYPSNIGS